MWQGVPKKLNLSLRLSRKPEKFGRARLRAHQQRKIYWCAVRTLHLYSKTFRNRSFASKIPKHLNYEPRLTLRRLQALAKFGAGIFSLDSVAHNISRLAPCPVLLVPPITR